MSFYTPPNTPNHAGAPKEQPYVGTLQFERSTTLVRVLVGVMYLLALVILVKAIEMVFTANPLAMAVGLGKEYWSFVAGTAIYGLALALIPLLLGRGIAHGSHDMWLLLLLAAVLSFLQSIPSLMNLDLVLVYAEGFAKVERLTMLVMPVVVLVLLFTPAVRDHCRK